VPPRGPLEGGEGAPFTVRRAERVRESGSGLVSGCSGPRSTPNRPLGPSSNTAGYRARRIGTFGRKSDAPESVRRSGRLTVLGFDSSGASDPVRVPVRGSGSHRRRVSAGGRAPWCPPTTRRTGPRRGSGRDRRPRWSAGTPRGCASGRHRCGPPRIPARWSMRSRTSSSCLPKGSNFDGSCGPHRWLARSVRKQRFYRHRPRRPRYARGACRFGRRSRRCSNPSIRRRHGGAAERSSVRRAGLDRWSPTGSSGPSSPRRDR
jgi:hypothetical protein